MRLSQTELAANDTGHVPLTARETAWRAATIEELIEIVRDLTRRVALCEVEIAGHNTVSREDDG